MICQRVGITIHKYKLNVQIKDEYDNNKKNLLKFCAKVGW